jgi:hypothetical protein
MGAVMVIAGRRAVAKGGRGKCEAMRWVFSWQASSRWLPRSNQTSKEYAMMAVKSWAAFECAALADVAHKKDQQQRLFDLGYQQGKVFIEALRSGKIDTEDVGGNVPVGWSDKRYRRQSQGNDGFVGFSEQEL